MQPRAFESRKSTGPLIEVRSGDEYHRGSGYRNGDSGTVWQVLVKVGLKVSQAAVERAVGLRGPSLGF